MCIGAVSSKCMTSFPSVYCRFLVKNNCLMKDLALQWVWDHCNSFHSKKSFHTNSKTSLHCFQHVSVESKCLF